MRSLDQLDQIEAAWRSLTLQDAAPFQTYTWNRTWYEEFIDEYDEMLIFLVSSGGEPRAIMPCYRIGDGIRLAADGICDYQDIIARSQSDAEMGFEMAWRWIFRNSPRSSLYVEKASSEGWLASLIRDRKTNFDKYLSFSRSFVPCPFAKVGSGMESYLATLPSKTRQDFRRSLKRLDRERPEASVEMLRSDEIDREQIEELSSYHVLHFRKQGESPFQDARIRRLLVAVACDPEVGLQLSVLHGGPGEILAMDCGFVRGRQCFGYMKAFDLAHRNLAPGKCLLLRRIDSWVERDGVEVVDFLSGNESYKYGYSQGNQYEISSHWMMPPSFRNQVRFVFLVVREFLRKKRNSLRDWMSRAE